MSRPTATAPVLTALLLAIAAGGSGATAAAQPAEKGGKGSPGASAPAAPAGSSEDSAPLRGPSVEGAVADERTLVRHDFAGRVVKLEVHPAEAAVRMLQLDAATAARVDAVLLERSRMLDALVSENLELLVKLQSARLGGDAEETARLMGELSAKAQPLRDRGQLAQELMTILSAQEGAELRRLMQEYWRAVVQEELRDKTAANDPSMEPGGARARRAGGAAAGREQRRDAREAMRQEVQEIVSGEIRRAYERTVGSAARDFDALLADLNVTPEQESRIRKIVVDSFQRTYGKATVQERTRIFTEVFALLDAQQKAEVIRRLGQHPPMQR